MKYTCFAMLAIALLLSSCDADEPLYKSLTKNEYKAHKAGDTIINTPKLLVTCTGRATHYNDMETMLVRKAFPEGVRYFKLAPDVYFENSKTLIEYQGFFSTGGEHGEFQDNGIWVYTDFYKDNFHSGMKFAVDSLPAGCNDDVRPKAEGIYFYRNHRLRRLSAGQSEEEFKASGKDGFYFIPNSGRFFKRHSAAIIK